MEEFDEDTLDLLDDDGDGVGEICLLFDEDSKSKQTGSSPTDNSGCCVVLLAVGTSMGMTVWSAIYFLT